MLALLEKELTEIEAGTGDIQMSDAVKANNKPDALRCAPIYIGGTDLPQGCTAGNEVRSCDRLRCLDCDHTVVIFNGYAWKSKSMDYLFLRNNFPAFARLRSGLSLNKSSRAFCCQCKWIDAKTVTRLDPAKLNWICNKHPL
ncbi:hypothetical protein TSMEX_010164 [Taenia solium]